MNPERWHSLVGELKDKFEILEEQHQSLEDTPGSHEWLIFISPLGKIKLEFISRPVVTGKKVITSKRIGASSSVQYTYSDTEFTYRIVAWKWNPSMEHWEEIRGDATALV